MEYQPRVLLPLLLLAHGLGSIFGKKKMWVKSFEVWYRLLLVLQEGAVLFGTGCLRNYSAPLPLPVTFLVSGWIHLNFTWLSQDMQSIISLSNLSAGKSVVSCIFSVWISPGKYPKTRNPCRAGIPDTCVFLTGIPGGKDGRLGGGLGADWFHHLKWMEGQKYCKGFFKR